MVLYTDGGCSGNGQRDIAQRQMVMAVVAEDGTVLSDRGQSGGSNNIAELAAVVDALAWCVAHQISDVEIRTDSQNNISWVNGRKLGKRLNDRATVLALKAQVAALRQQVRVKLLWVPREENKAGHYVEQRYGT